MSISLTFFLRTFFLIASLKIISIISVSACLSCEIIDHTHSPHSPALRAPLRIPVGNSSEGFHYAELPKSVPFSRLRTIIINRRKELGFKPSLSDCDLLNLLQIYPWYRGTEQTINTPFSGKLISCAVTHGQQLCKGDLLFTVEAMKMVSYIHAPIAGTLCTIRYKPNETIGTNAVVMSILPPPSEWDIVPESELEKERDVLLSLFTQDNNNTPSNGPPTNRPTLSTKRASTIGRYNPYTMTGPTLCDVTFSVITSIKFARLPQDVTNSESLTNRISRLLTLQLRKQRSFKFPMVKNRSQDPHSQTRFPFAPSSHHLGDIKRRLLPNIRMPLIDLKGLLREFFSHTLPTLSKKSVNLGLTCLSMSIILSYFLYGLNTTSLTFVRNERGLSRRTRNLKIG